MWDKYFSLSPNFFLVSNLTVFRISTPFLNRLLLLLFKCCLLKASKGAHYVGSERQPKILRARVYEVGQQGKVPFLHTQH
jgi:hypothetical protein